MNKTDPDDANLTAQAKRPSKYEWLPVLALPVLLAVHYFLARPDGSLAKLTFFVCLGLVPGIVVRLAGRPSWNTHRVFFALSLIGFVLDNPELRPDSDTIAKALANWHLVALGFLAAFTQPVWGALRAHRLLSDSGIAITKRETLKLSLVGSFFNVFLPGSTGGDAYRVFALVKNYRGKLAAAIASITLDRFLGLPSLILVVVLGMFMEFDFFRSNRVLSGLAPFIAAAAAVCLAFVLYLALAGKSGRAAAGGAAEDAAAGTKESARLRTGRKAFAWAGRLHDMVARNVTSRSTLPLALLHGFLSHLACIASCLCFGLALGVVGVPSLRYFLIVPMAMTINAIPGAPGGVGQGELAMATLLDMAHPGAGNAQTGVMVMLLFRLANMTLGVLGGVLYALGKSAARPGPADLSAAAGELEGRAGHGD